MTTPIGDHTLLVTTPSPLGTDNHTPHPRELMTTPLLVTTPSPQGTGDHTLTSGD